MNKKDREMVFNKYGGRCGYCGCELTKGWHLDHIEPIGRRQKFIHSHWIHKVTKQKAIFSELKNNHDKYDYVDGKMVPDGFNHPERDTVENAMPSCAKCNINKHGDSIEGFRESIKGYLNSLNLRMVQYQMVKKYGLVTETGIEVKFYFETYKF